MLAVESFILTTPLVVNVPPKVTLALHAGIDPLLVRTVFAAPIVSCVRLFAEPEYNISP